MLALRLIAPKAPLAKPHEPVIGQDTGPSNGPTLVLLPIPALISFSALV